MFMLYGWFTNSSVRLSNILRMHISFFIVSTPPCNIIIPWHGDRRFPDHRDFVDQIDQSSVDTLDKGPVCGTLGFSMLSGNTSRVTNSCVAGDLRRDEAHVTSLRWNNYFLEKLYGWHTQLQGSFHNDVDVGTNTAGICILPLYRTCWESVLSFLKYPLQAIKLEYMITLWYPRNRKLQ